jgi:hypothetical protein
MEITLPHLTSTSMFEVVYELNINDKNKVGFFGF